jgi:hypothetical protein
MGDGISRNLRDGQLIVQDAATPTVHSKTIDLDEGDFKMDWTPDGGEPKVILNRGVLSHFRKGDEKPVGGSFSAKLSKIIADTGAGDSVPSEYEALTLTGLAASWTTTGLSGEPKLCKLVIKVANPNTSGRREVITLDKVKVSKVSFEEGEEYDKLSFEFVARITAPTITFEAQS